METSDRPLLALGLRAAAAALIATMFALVKLASQIGVSVPEIMFWRQAITVPLLLGWLAMRGETSRLRTRRLKAHAARSLTGTFGMVLNFTTIILLPLAAATTLQFTTPLFAVILTGFLLREKVGVWRWSAVLLGFIGVLIITQPGHSPIDPLGAATGLAAAFMVAVISFQVRDLTKQDDPLACVFWFAVFGSLVLGAVLPFFARAHSPDQWLMLLAIGIVGTAAQFMMTIALKFGPVATIIVMDYTALVFATGYGWWLFGNLPPSQTWLGAPAIIAAGLVITWREHRRARL